MRKKETLLFLLILGTAFWGLSFSVTKMAMGNHSPFIFLFYRFMLASAVLAVIFWKQVKNVSANAVFSGAVLAIPLMCGISLQTMGIKYTAASQCSFIAGTTVILIPVIKLFLYQKAAPLKVWLAAMLALTGLFVISIKAGFIIGKGDLFTIAGALGFAIYLILVERKSTGRDLIPTIVPMFATCAMLSFGLAYTGNHADWLPGDTTFWVGIVFCGLFSTAYMYTISNISQRYISAERVAIIYLFEPVFGAVAAFFILNESLSWRLLLGGALIVAASVIAELKRKSNGGLEVTN